MIVAQDEAPTTVFDVKPTNVITPAPTAGERIEEATEELNRFQRWLASDQVQQWLVEKPFEIILTIIGAILLHAILVFVINKLEKMNIGKSLRVQSALAARLGRRNPGAASKRGQATEAMVATQEERRQSRIRTLSSVGKSAVAIFVWVWAVIAILTTVGVNVTPLLASAGVAGVALGFGAQSLVKDFLSGIFMLIEDQYGVGDWINVGEVEGTVEEVTLRLTTLRDNNGTLWYIRNGEILRIGNSSQEYAVAVINSPVSLKADTNEATEAVKRAVEQAIERPDIAELLLKEPEFDGVNAIKVDHMIIRTRLEVLPGQQWFVEREVGTAIIREFRKAGIPAPNFVPTTNRPE